MDVAGGEGRAKVDIEEKTPGTETTVSQNLEMETLQAGLTIRNRNLDNFEVVIKCLDLLWSVSFLHGCFSPSP